MSSEDELKTMKDPADGSSPTPPPQSKMDMGALVNLAANGPVSSKSDPPPDEETKSKTEANVDDTSPKVESTSQVDDQQETLVQPRESGQSVKGENSEQVAEPDNLSQSFAGNTGVITLTQSFNREKGEASIQPRFTRVKTSTLVWVSLAISISTLLIVAFILGRVVTPSPPISESASSAMPVVITSTQNLASDVAEEIRLLRGEIQALRDQVAALTKSQISADEIKALAVQSTNSTKPQASAEWPTILLTIVFAIACFVFAGYVLTRPSTSPEIDGKAKFAARVAVISAIVAGILIPVSQNLSSIVPTPVWPCTFHTDWCGYAAPTTAIQPASGTVTATMTPELTLSASPYASPTVTAGPTRSQTPSPTLLPPAPIFTATPTSTLINVPLSPSPQPPGVINNYIYTCQCCSSGRTTTVKTICITPTPGP
jgi:hypothetical protein